MGVRQSILGFLVAVVCCAIVAGAPRTIFLANDYAAKGDG